MERHFPGVYYAPGRWETSDGYIPFPVFDRYVAALFPALALERMNLTQGIGLAFGGKDGEERWLATVREAYPEEG